MGARGYPKRYTQRADTYLDDKLKLELLKAAKRERISEAEVLRRALSHYVAAPRRRTDQAVAV